jgi:hypothetical protein
MTGTIVDGWEYVWAAYVIAWMGLVAYSVTLLWRERRSRDNDSGSEA